jgi:hypothetical protein
MRRNVKLTVLAKGHVEQARRNYRLYQQLCSQDEYPDWAMTLLFYTALHLVQAYIRQYGEWFPQTHDARREFINEDRRLEALWYDYRELYDQSRNVRYNLRSITQAEVKNFEGHQFGRIIGVLRRNGIDLHEQPESSQ